MALDNLPKGWFAEISEFWPGQAQALQVEEVLWDKQSDFQDVKVYKTTAWGTVMTLDGAIQVTDNDEFSYHENMAHIPCFAHKEGPKDVLIIGGGDGGVMREVLRHPSVQTVTLCDIDKMVCDVSRLFFPQCAVSLDDPRAKVNIGDGFAFMEDKVNAYDVIIVDSSDPVGPASTLFGREFFERCKRALRPGGILCTQAESMWIHLDMIHRMMGFIKSIGYESVEYACIQIPSYPSGSIGFFLCSNTGSCAQPNRAVPEDFLEPLKYYEPDMHSAAFKLPRRVRCRLAEPAPASTEGEKH
jgi:spermidine synthase